VVVVNTCSVTAEADRSARAFIRRTHRLNPQAKIVVTGCYAQRAPQELAGLTGVAAVVGNSHKALAPEIILGLVQCPDGVVLRVHDDFSLVSRGLWPNQVDENASAASAPEGRYENSPGRKPWVGRGAESPSPGGAIEMSPQIPEGSIQKPSQLIPTHSLVPIWADDRFAHSFLEEAQITPGAQTRPNLKIQEGCGNRCTFCVIPFTRGLSKSLPAAGVLRQVEGFVAAGGRELVLSGINLGRWGRDSSDSEAAGKPTLARLLRTIFAQTELARLRLSSIEPMDWDAELIGVMAEFAGKRLARHAHLPLQSGSDAVLRRMHRRYRPWHYAEKVAALVEAAGPELTLGADVMVGFPGESDAEFEETVALIKALPFGYLHLFPFSPRPGTPGWLMHAERPIPLAIAEERMAALRALASEKSKTHRMRFIGQELEAITLHTPAEMAARGRSAALTENFLPVELEGRTEANQLVRVQVSTVSAMGALEVTILEPKSIQ
jgi:threonylcarbamoyladenosine tRNA methylthiotransferase MtaB